MHDTTRHQPDMPDLFRVALGQQGYFTSKQAHESGVSNDLIRHYVQSGRLIRTYRGVFRFRDFPSSPREHIAAAWLATGKDQAVVSHESALELLELTDVIPFGIHLTVPRAARHTRAVPGVVLHTTTHEIASHEILDVDGLPVTSVERTVADVAAAGLSPEHVHRAVLEALERGVTSESGIRNAAATKGNRVRQMIDQAIAEAARP
jgi:predicted transcriptional regulator of viral defense system